MEAKINILTQEFAGWRRDLIRQISPKGLGESFLELSLSRGLREAHRAGTNAEMPSLLLRPSTRTDCPSLTRSLLTTEDGNKWGKERPLLNATSLFCSMISWSHLLSQKLLLFLMCFDYVFLKCPETQTQHQWSSLLNPLTSLLWSQFFVKKHLIGRYDTFRDFFTGSLTTQKCSEWGHQGTQMT